MDSLDCISVRKDKLEKHTIIHVSQIYFREKKCVFPKKSQPENVSLHFIKLKLLIKM